MNERGSLAERLERDLSDAGLYIVIGDTGREISLTGLVETEAEHEAVRDIVARVVGGAREVSDNVEVTGALPGDTMLGDLSEVEIEGFPGAEPGLADPESLDPGDFTDQRTTQSAGEAQLDALSTAPSDDPTDDPSEGNVVYVPPIDPVGTDRNVIGGLQESSMESIEVERSSDGTLGDEAIRDAILRELREDSATTALTIEVEVVAGTARLRGRVDDLDDVESAEEVAARVPGVVEVIEEFEVEHPA